VKSPFCTLTVPVNLDDGGIHHRVFHIRLLSDGFEYPRENVRGHPIAKPRVDRAPVAEEGRKIPPGATGPRDPEDRLQKPPVVGSATIRIAGFAQAMRFHLRPLGVRQNESVHRQLELQTSVHGNPESQQTLDDAGVWIR
jgi:hypothetical protein